MEDHEALDTAEHIVMNRDIPLLSRVFYTMQDIVSLEKRSEWQYERMFSITKRLKAMPGGGGLPSGLDQTYAEVEEMNHEYGEAIRQYVNELKAAERILNGIESRTMRTFVQMYYVDHIGKTEIMRELDMTEYGFKRARMCIEQAEDIPHVRWREHFVLGHGR